MSNIVPVSFVDELIWPSWEEYASCAEEAEYPDLWNGLVGAWYPSLGKTGGTLFDISGRDNHGTLTNMDPATDWVIGQQGQVLRFAAGDYVALSNVSTLKPTKAITVAFTCKPNPTYKFAVGWNNDYTIAYFIGATSSGNWFFYLAGVFNWQVGIVPPITPGAWSHLAHTWDGATMAVYANGKLVSSIAKSGTISYSGATTPKLGYVTAAYNHIGDFGTHLIYDRALVPSEIQLLYEYPDALVIPRQQYYPVMFTTPTTPLSIYHLLPSSWLQRQSLYRSNQMDWSSVFGGVGGIKSSPVEWITSIGGEITTGGTGVVLYPHREEGEFIGWQDDWAGCAEEAEYPELWKGLVGAWMPSLGPTGLTLRDISGFGNNGTLATSMSYELVVDRYAVKCTNSGRSLSFGNILSLDGGSITTSAWIYKPTTMDAYCNIIGKADASWTFGLTGAGAGGLYFYVNNVQNYQVIPATADTWQHVAATFQYNGNIIFYVNGKPSAPVNPADNPAASSGILTLFERNGLHGWIGSIASVLVHNRVLTPSEIKLLYEEPNALVIPRQRVYPVMFSTLLTSNTLPAFTIPNAWEQGIQEYRDIPTEWSSEVGTTPLTDYESLPIDWLNQFQDYESLPSDWLEKLSDNESLPSDWLSQFQDDESLPTEWTSEIPTTPLTDYESLPIDWLEELQNTHNIPSDWRSIFTRDYPLPSEWLNRITDGSTIGTTSRLSYFSYDQENTSLEDNFACNAEESKYPNLWNNLVGAWMPALGKQGNRLYDLSGYKKDGIFMADIDPITDWIMGDDKITRGIQFTKNTSNSQNHISIPTITVKSSDLGNSFCAWFKGTEVNQYLLSRNDVGASPYDPPNSYIEIYSSSYIRWREDGRVVGTIYGFNPSPNTLDNKWHMICGTQDYMYTRLYVDGKEVVSSPQITDDGYSETDWQQIGSNVNGQMSNVLIYNRVLYPVEIQDLYFYPNAPFIPKKKYLPVAVAGTGVVVEGVNKNTNVDWLKSISINPSVPVSWLGAGVAVTVTGSMPVSWLLNLSLPKQFGVSYISEIEEKFGSPIAWTQSLSNTHEITIAFENGLEIGKLVPIEWSSVTTAVQQFGNLPIEWRLATASLEVFGNLPIDWSYTSSPLLGGTWILDSRGTKWILGSRGRVWTLPSR